MLVIHSVDENVPETEYVSNVDNIAIEILKAFTGSLQLLQSLQLSAIFKKHAIAFAWNIFTLILTLYLSHQSSLEIRELKEELTFSRKNQKLIIERLDEIKSHAFQLSQSINQSVFYTAKRWVPLNITTRYRSNYVMLIQPGQPVELLGRMGKWIKVRAIAPSGEEQEGWVLKKYLKRQST